MLTDDDVLAALVANDGALFPFQIAAPDLPAFRSARARGVIRYAPAHGCYVHPKAIDRSSRGEPVRVTEAYTMGDDE